MDRLVFHVDVNSAFLSWEAARRVANGEPDIRLIPSASVICAIATVAALQELLTVITKDRINN